MADDIGEVSSSQKKRKRKTLSNRPKLLVDDKVEVRSIKDKLGGSWRSGIVITRENQARRVQYDHLFYDNSIQPHIESIKVHPIVDGIIPASRVIPCNHRGLIRPLPPPVDFTKCSLQYGYCVDVYHTKAWWEGVIFDHEHGSECRTIFFPDVDLKIQFKFDMLRITQDWDEFTEDWKIRGKWLFLELVEEFEQEWPVRISVKQIWHQVREKKGFQKLMEWTSTLRSTWKILVWEVIFDNCKRTLNQILLDAMSRPEAGSVAVSDGPFVSPLLAQQPNTCLEVSVIRPPDDRVVKCESEYCPQAMVDYYLLGSVEKNDNWKCYKGAKVKELQFKAKKHLTAVGWSFWYISKGQNRELRYTSPKGRSYNSLRTACKGYLDEEGILF
ncbi:uncharacterized protein LOC114320276 isoform X2 [Camellia sinensis]|uniref:uncharacterized protein LOC114320276 isoform X2 n=1 Tax=Camellia sinensis TaxID=4442 RepID=UPI001035D1D0|nr:uncharacterized protein LOC114320276 isoform X2 [Camellia sinensis]